MNSALRRIFFAVTFIFLESVTGASGQSFTLSHAKISLVAEGNSLVAGHTVWIGVLFDLDKGWHTYWVNPGDSGSATRIQWKLPAGFRAGDIRWPVPMRLGIATVVDYGYEGRVLLAAPIEIPADYKPDQPMELAADVRYLVCREVCIPATAHPTLTIPIPTTGAAEHRALFANARHQWPRPMPTTWKAEAKDDGNHFVLSIETGSRELHASFFPLDENEIDGASPAMITPLEHGVKIRLKKSDGLTGPISDLKGVAVLGPNRAVEVVAPVMQGR